MLIVIFFKILENFGFINPNEFNLGNIANSESQKNNTQKQNKNTSKSKKYYTPKFSNDELVVATFNVEWLGDGNTDRKPRSEADYNTIAKIISELNADIVGLQEIENANAIKKILTYLKGYKYKITENKSAQNVAYLYNSKLEIKRSFVSDRIDIAERSTRPALVMECKKSNFDFVVANVHLKSTSRYDNTAEKKERSFDLRGSQVIELNKLADSIINAKKELDVILLGDFNDTPVRKKNPTLTPLLENPNLVFITKDMKSCKNRSMYSIDHIISSKSAYNRFAIDSERNFDINLVFGKDVAQNISDHCPIILNFEIKSKDND